MITGIISDFQKGGSYLTNSKPQQGTKLVDHIPLQALKTLSFSFQGQEHTIRDCPSEVLEAFITQYTEVDNIRSEQWGDIFMRWRIINFLIDDGALEVENSMLVEVQEPASDFLEQAARAREIMRDNPEIDSAGLAEALGISSKLYAHTIKVYVNAQQEGA